jgi:hypothetical protein
MLSTWGLEVSNEGKALGGPGFPSHFHPPSNNYPSDDAVRNGHGDGYNRVSGAAGRRRPRYIASVPCHLQHKGVLKVAHANRMLALSITWQELEALVIGN